MVVRTECKGCKVTGLYIGARNVRRKFPKGLAAVEFELGHLHIDCKLAPGFWKDQPKISDARLCEWLEFKLYRERRYITPLPLALVQAGKHAFKLRPVALPPISLIAIGESKSGIPVRHHHAGDGVRKVHRQMAHASPAL